MISILLPTRQRPGNLTRLVRSINDTASCSESIELVVYVDDDDSSYDNLELDIKWTMIRGPRLINGIVNLSAMWNVCYYACVGDIIMHCGDDIVFRTPGWDDTVCAEFDREVILHLWGDDGYNDAIGTHSFIHRKWVETVGYLFPPLFESDFNDLFLSDVARMIDRDRKIDIRTEHMHFMAGKAEIDQNTRERLERHEQSRPQDLYYSEEVQDMIKEAAIRLQRYIDMHQQGDRQ